MGKPQPLVLGADETRCPRWRAEVAGAKLCHPLAHRDIAVPTGATNAVRSLLAAAHNGGKCLMSTPIIVSYCDVPAK